MAGITLAMAETRLQQYMDAEQAVLSGQQYEIAGRMLKRADLASIQQGIEYWNNWCKRLSARSSGRAAAITPRPRF